MVAGSPASKSSGRLNGDDLRAMFSTATQLLERNVESINALNVFPVPDGDTGTNMFLTLRSVVDSAGPLEGAAAGDVADGMARGALMGARGNSGVILSQFFKGVAVALEGAQDFGAEELAGAYQQAREYAYKAVGEPVEGTMLTVISSVAEAAREASDREESLNQMCEAVCVAARDSVARTPTMLAVLREAGVVDAGGQGLAVILEGVRRSVAGEASDDLEVAAPEPVGVEGATGGVSSDFLAATDEEMYGYCTQFIVEGDDLDIDAMRERMKEMAHSTVVVGDSTMVKVHVHADDPGPVLSVGASAGTLGQVNIQNMDEQHSGFAAARREEADDAATVSVVAVAWGLGLEVLFTSLGASGIVAGGDTMNPSVQELIDAVAEAPSDDVVILPNNRNIVPAAEQAAEGSDKTVRVIPTRSIPQGVSAILCFNAERDLAANVRDMEEAVSSVKTGEITEAVRSATLNGVAVEKGQIMGLLDNELVAAGDDLSDVTVSVLSRAGLSGDSLVTLYSGEQVASDETSVVAQDVTAAFPDIELELVDGGQPLYHFIMSIEE